MKKRILFAFLLLTNVFILDSAFSQSKKSTTSTKQMDKFIDELIAKMTLDEKIGQLNLVTPGGAVTGAVVSADVDNKIRSGYVGGMFGIRGVEQISKAQEIAVNYSRLKIPLIFGLDVIHGHQTVFPIPLALSCTWDTQLIKETAAIAASEATADGICWTFSPMVDISRDPRWGRIAEGSGEDPYLGSLIAAAMVQGYQGNNLAAANTMMACVKHFALYGASEAGRDYNTTDMSRVRMYNEYLPPYKAAFDAGAGSAMSSFNEIDGIPATGNKWLMTELLRNQWKFNGFVVTDYTAIMEMIDHGMGDLQKVSELALKAGTDMDMVSEGFLGTLKKSYEEGKISEKEITQACRRILEAKYKLGLFEDPFRYCDPNRAKNNLNAEYRAKARTAAVKSAVLLKNDSTNVLPLKKTGKIALIGPMAAAQKNIQGMWTVSGDYKTAITVLAGVKKEVGDKAKILYSKGADASDSERLGKGDEYFISNSEMTNMNPDSLLNEAIKVASESDVIVAVLGEPDTFSGEANSLTNINLQDSQKKLLVELRKLNKPLVLLIMSGRPLTIGPEIEMANAAMQLWHLGTETGTAVADLLFGDKNPSGKLTITFPRNVGQIPIYYNRKNTGRPFDPLQPTQKFKSQYLDVDNTPLFPFGYGLSYTTFEYSPVTLSTNKLTDKETITASVTVKNTGKYDGSETVQLYIRDHVASITRPLKELKGFDKAVIKKGESKTFTFKITTEMLKFYNPELKYVSEPGMFSVFIGKDSDTQNKADFELLK